MADHVGGGERAALEHGTCTVAHFFCRLKDHEHIPDGGLVAKESRSRHGPRRVHVVPAGVHDAHILRGERQSGALGDRERIDVAAQCDDGRCAVASANSQEDAPCAK